MASKGITLVVEDSSLLALDRIDAATDRRAEVLDAIGAYLLTATQRRFERETAPDGQRWQRLSPRTARRRINGRERGYNNILRVSRRLEQSIFHDVVDDQLMIGSNLPYAAIHQLGGEIEMPERQQTIFQHYDAKTDTFDQRFRTKRRSNFARDVTVSAHTITMPARPYLGIDDADRAEISEIIAEHYRTVGGAQ